MKMRMKFPGLFTDKLGMCLNFKATFDIEDNARPVRLPCRQVAFAMVQPLEEELRRLEDGGIIECIESSTWASLIVIVKKHSTP